MLVAAHDPQRPLHVGTLLGNTPEMLRAMAAAGLGGYVLCGINTTRRGEGLLADVRRADCQFLLTDAEHLPLLDGLDLTGVTVIDVDRARLGRAPRGSGPARAVPRGRRDGHPDDDLHLGHQRRPEGRPGGAPDGALLGAEPGRAVLGHRRRRLLHLDAAVPLERGGGGLGGRARLGCGDGAGAVLGVPVPLGRAALRRDVHELRRQAAGLRPGHAGAARRRRQPAAGRVRQRGQRPRHRGVRAPLRLRRDGRLRLDRARDHHHPRARHAPRLDRAGRRRGGDLRPRDASPSARSRSSTPTGALLNADQAIGELVNTEGAGYFQGYYNDTSANEERMRHGMYWSGDLAYRDADGLDLPGRPHRGLDARGRREPRRRPDRAHPPAAPGGRPGRGVRRPRPQRRRPGDGRASPPGRRRADAFGAHRLPRRAAGPVDQGLAALRPDRPRRSRRPPPTRCSSASSSPRAPVAGDGVLWVREERGTAFSVATRPATNSR